MFRLGLALTIALIARSSVAAEPELLPAPREVEAAKPIAVLPAPTVEMGPLGPALPGYWRRSQYDKWQNLAVDREGFWRARVILAPQPYYWYNGLPYYWQSTRPLDLTPGPR